MKSFEPGDTASCRDEHGASIVCVGSKIDKRHVMLSERSPLYAKLIGRIGKRLDLLVGNIDQAERWARYSYRTVKRLIDERDIDVLVASGHPCSINYWAAVLKSERPQVKLVQDFRDTWNNELNYEMKPGYLGSRAKERSVVAENIAIANADIVLNVSAGQSARMQRASQTTRGKFHVLTNGFDPSDLRTSTPHDAMGVRMVHAGTVRWHAAAGLAHLVQAIAELDGLAGLERLTIDFYGQKPKLPQSQEAARVLAKHFRFHGVVDSERLAKEVAGASLGLIIFDKDTGLGTKTFDYMVMSKPFLAICPEGELQRFCLEHDMPVASYNVGEIKRTLLDIINGSRSLTLDKSRFERFAIPVLAEEFEKLVS